MSGRHLVTFEQKQQIWTHMLEALEIAIDRLYQQNLLTPTASETADLIANFIQEIIKRLTDIQKKIEYKPYKRLMGPPPPPLPPPAAPAALI